MTATINTKEGVCTMALGYLGSYPSVNSIDNPKTTIETTFATFYDTVRQDLLKTLIPNFAMQRRYVGQLTTFPTFGWSFAYEYPADCLRLLGIGEVQEKKKDFAVENNTILTNYSPSTITTGTITTAALPIRFIGDMEDVGAWSPEFKRMCALYLAEAVCLPLTQSAEKQRNLTQMLPMKLSAASAVNAQENPPMRISRSRFKMARYVNNPRTQEKY